MKKTFNEILGKGTKIYGETVYPKDYVIQILKLVREKTIEECIEKGYGLYYEDKFDYNPSIVSINKESLEKLDKESIKE